MVQELADELTPKVWWLPLPARFGRPEAYFWSPLFEDKSQATMSALEPATDSNRKSNHIRFVPIAVIVGLTRPTSYENLGCLQSKLLFDALS
jgi:hypothetical protein